MRAIPGSGSAAAADPWLAGGAVAALGAGTVVALAGAGTGDVRLALGGGLALLAGLVVLLAAGWVSGPTAVALSLPLPALYADAGVRIAAAAPVTAAVVFAGLLAWGAERRPLDLGALPRRSLVVLAGAFLLAALFTAYPLASARELLNIAVLLGLLLVATDALRREPDRIRSLIALLVAVAAVTGALAVLETIAVIPGEFPRWGTRYYRAALGFGQPNGLGLFLAIMLPLAVHHVAIARGGLQRGLALLAAAAVVAGLGATFSRGAWLAVLAGAAVFLLTRDYRRAIGTWAGAALALIVLDMVSGGMIRDTVARTVDDWVIEQRAALMLVGVLMFLDSPLLGLGPGGFAEALDRYGAQIPQLWDYLPTPHNAYVQMAAEAGVVGLIALLVFFGAALLGLVRLARAAARDTEAGPEAADSDATDPEAADRQRALLWAFATAVCAGAVVWPFAHGTGQAVVLVLALGFAAGAAAGGATGRAEAGAARSARPGGGATAGSSDAASADREGAP